MNDRAGDPQGDATTQAVVKLLRDGFLDPKTALDPDDPLFDSGLIDSMGFIRLLARIEKELSVSIPMSEILIENFDTVNKIAAAVRKRRQGG